MSGYLPNFLAQAQRLGFTLDGYTGGGHPRLRNDAGDVVTIPSTPSDWRSAKNSLLQLERLAGQRLPRANSGKYQYRRQPQLCTELSPAEKAMAEQVDVLLADADVLRGLIAELVAEPTRAAAAEARLVLARYEHTRRLLAQHHHIISPIA